MLPDSVQLQVSGSIIKNVKSVIVPNTGHLEGHGGRRVAAGIIAGSAEKELEVISEVSEGKEVCHPGLSADGAHHHRAHRAGACV